MELEHPIFGFKRLNIELQTYTVFDSGANVAKIQNTA